MNAYVARQPIFERDMKLFGYELLYRNDANNCFQCSDAHQATNTVLNNTFLTSNYDDLVSNGLGFINFPAESLLKGIPLLLPNHKVIIEILETVEDSDEILAACRLLKEQGYQIALDDFSAAEHLQKNYKLIEYADIIKVDFMANSKEEQKRIIASYRHRKSIKFLAEKIETREDFQTAQDLGFELFQGYFFSKPKMIILNDLKPINTNLLQIQNELNKSDYNLTRIAQLVETDVGLTYKLLKIANSAYFSARQPITSVKGAIVFIGHRELMKWCHVLLISDFHTKEDSELIQQSLIRARIMSQISCLIQKPQQQFEFFITGLFSSIHVILGRNMSQIIKELPLPKLAADALMGLTNELRTYLDMIVSFERADWEAIESNPNYNSQVKEKFMPIFIEALNWQKGIPM